ncbi:MAG: hypothetical protein AAF351_03610 [Pseudomonadota bacterium]
MRKDKLITTVAFLFLAFSSSLVIHARVVSDGLDQIALFSVDNLKGVAKWWLIGSPLIVFLALAPDRYFVNDDEGEEE